MPDCRTVRHMSGSISHLAEGNNALFILQGSVKVCMEKTDIEFYNGLAKGIIKCRSLLEKTQDIESAKKELEALLEKVRAKFAAMVDLALT